MNKHLATKEAVLDLAQMSKAAGTLQALMQHLATDRFLLEGSTQRSGVTFARVGDTVIRVSSEVEKSPMVFNWAQNSIRYAPDRVSVNIAPATEAELLDAQRAMEAHGTGEQRIRIREFIAHVRNDGATAPLQVEILNPERIGAVEKILTVKRDDTGKLSGAVSQPIS